MESQLEYHTALAWLEWQVELGADEAIGESPVDRFAVPEPQPAVAPVSSPAVKAEEIDPVVEARRTRLKTELLGIAASCNRGEAAMAADLSTARALVGELESLSPTAQPTLSPYCEGTWALAFADTRVELDGFPADTDSVALN